MIMLGFFGVDASLHNDNKETKLILNIVVPNFNLKKYSLKLLGLLLFIIFK